MAAHTFYKIMRKSDGKYSNGGSKPSFTLRGKTWDNLHSLKSHLRAMRYNPDVYEACQVVELELVTLEPAPFDLESWVTEAQKARLAATLAGKTIW